MVHLTCTLESGVITGVDMNGHAGQGFRGSDPVCAALTILVRTYLRNLESLDALDLVSTASVPGSLDFRFKVFPEGLVPVLRAWTRFLLVGLGDIKQEYPDSLELSLIE